MDEKMMNTEELRDEQKLQELKISARESVAGTEESTSAETVHVKGLGETLESIFTSSEGGFLGFAITLCLGYFIHAITSNSYKAKVKLPKNLEFSVYKEEEHV